jgi:hypothetical protein
LFDVEEEAELELEVGIKIVKAIIRRARTAHIRAIRTLRVTLHVLSFGSMPGSYWRRPGGGRIEDFAFVIS